VAQHCRRIDDRILERNGVDTADYPAFNDCKLGPFQQSSLLSRRAMRSAQFYIMFSIARRVVAELGTKLSVYEH